MSKKFTSTVAGASILITAISILAKGFGFVREMVFAGTFGLGKSYDVYLVSSVIPVTIFTVVYYIAQNYYIPLFAEARKANNLEGFFSKNIFLFLFGNIILTIVLYSLTGPIINFFLKSNSEELIQLAKKIYRMFLICIPFSALNAYIISYFQSDLEYRLPAYSQIIQNILVILLIAILSKTIGILAIPIGFIIGTLFQFVFLFIYSFKIFNLGMLSGGYLLRSGIFNSSIVFVILIEVLGQFYMLADRYFFDKVDSGGIAAVNYGLNIFQLPIIIFTFALSTAMFPKFSISVANKDVNAIKKNIKDIMFVNIFIFVPIFFIMFFYGDTLIKIIYQRGKFTADDTLLTFSLLKYLSISLLFYAIYGVLNKLFYSYNLTKVLFVLTIIGITLKIVLNIILVSPLKQNGLVISTVITYMFFFICAFIVFRNKIKLEFEMVYLNKFLLYFLNGVISLVITALFPLAGLLRIIMFLLIFYMNLFIVKENTLVYFIELKNNIISSWIK